MSNGLPCTAGDGQDGIAMITDLINGGNITLCGDHLIAYCVDVVNGLPDPEPAPPAPAPVVQLVPDADDDEAERQAAFDHSQDDDDDDTPLPGDLPGEDVDAEHDH